MASVQSCGFRTLFDGARRGPFSGRGRLAGDAPAGPDDGDGRARVMNVPGRINIVITEPFTLAVVARTISRDDGTWEVPYLDVTKPFTVIGIDVTRQVNSAIQDWVYPAPME